MKLAVIGKDVSQSQSPKMHGFILKKLGVEDFTYEKVSISSEEFEDKVEEIFSTYDFFNVTIPFKLDVMPHLNEIVDDAKIFGAVNTIKSRARRGYNTDGLGFMLMLKNNGVEVSGKRALVLGSGGAGRSVTKKLLDGGADVEVFDVNKESLKRVCDEFPPAKMLESLENKSYDIIVNCTGVGMHKSVGISPVSEQLISLCSVAVDLIYVPEKSKFLEIAESCGKKIINGMGMLFYQAYYADCIFLGIEADEKKAKEFFEEYVREN